MAALRADQRRAIDAYTFVEDVPHQYREDYEGAVLRFGVDVLRDGLLGALAPLQKRKGDKPIQLLFEHLARAGVPGLVLGEGKPEDTLPECVRKLDAASYMLATRELLKFVQWLKRAAQATF